MRYGIQTPLVYEVQGLLCVIGGQEPRPTVGGEIGSSIGQAAIEHKPLPLYSNPVESEFARIGSYRQQFSFSFAVMVGSGTYRQQAWVGDPGPPCRNGRIGLRRSLRRIDSH